jgi:uncharacterized repeat protein (TIGR03803 family)
LTTLHNFHGGDGGYPLAGLVQATDGNLYGTTAEGGANGYGLIFRMTLAGTLKTVYTFKSIDGNGNSGLVQATNRTFYGTTYGGGTSGDGTVFSLSVRPHP